jgi:hypothetical protein
MAEQTAIKWLEKKIEEKAFQCQTEWQSGYQSALNEVIFFLEQAKAMEQQQIKDAVIYGLDEDGHTGDWKIKFVNDYYNKTFKS